MENNKAVDPKISGNKLFDAWMESWMKNNQKAADIKECNDFVQTATINMEYFISTQDDSVYAEMIFDKLTANGYVMDGGSWLVISE